MSNINRIVDGVVCIISTRFRPISLANVIGSTITMVIPSDNGSQLSNTKISKEIVVKLAILFFLVNSILSFIPMIKLCTNLCSNITPLGFPVEPDV